MAGLLLRWPDVRSSEGGVATRIGEQVKFQTRSVFLWPAEEPLSALPPDTEIQGSVMEFSDSGSEERVFAVIEVVKKHTVIVPVSELEVIEQETE